jgi:hypothetical protein
MQDLYEKDVRVPYVSPFREPRARDYSTVDICRSRGEQ